MAHTFVYAAAALILEFLLGLGLALLLNSQIRGRGLFRASVARPDDAAGCGCRRGLASDAESELRRDQRNA